MKAFTFVAGLVSFGTTSAVFAAEDWLLLPNSDPNISFYVDKLSIERQGNLVRFWERLVYVQPKIKDEVSGKMVKEKKVRRLMNCNDHTQGLISGASYTENGRFISSVVFDEPLTHMSPIPPGTLADEEFRLVCQPVLNR